MALEGDTVDEAYEFAAEQFEQLRTLYEERPEKRLYLAIDTDEVAPEERGGAMNLAQQLVLVRDFELGGAKFGRQLFVNHRPQHLVEVARSRGADRVYIDTKYYDDPLPPGRQKERLKDRGIPDFISTTLLAPLIHGSPVGRPLPVLHSVDARVTDEQCAAVFNGATVKELLTSHVEQAVAMGIFAVAVASADAPIIRNYELTSAAERCIETSGGTGLRQERRKEQLVARVRGAFLFGAGIRLPGDGMYRTDPARVVDHLQAVACGADAIMLGRSVTRDAEPRQKVRAIVAELGG